MTKHSPILPYVTPPPTPPQRLTLEESNGSVRVIFPVAPTWAYVLPFATSILFGCVALTFSILIARMFLQMVNSTGLPPADLVAMRRLAFKMLLMPAPSALFCWAIAAYEWRMYYHWGRVPRMLIADRETLAFSRLGWWRIRERKWPANQISGVELRPVKGNLNWRRTVADLYICRHEGRRLRYRLSSPDRELPTKIGQRLAAALGCPLQV